MIVVDSSALVHSYTADTPNPELIDKIATSPLAAPHLIDAEYVHAIRGLSLGQKISAERANLARVRVQHHSGDAV